MAKPADMSLEDKTEENHQKQNIKWHCKVPVSSTTGSGLKLIIHAEFNFCLCYANQALQVFYDLLAQMPAF